MPSDINMYSYLLLSHHIVDVCEKKMHECQKDAHVRIIWLIQK